METGLVRFVNILRIAGLKIGSGEVIDALKALEVIDFSRREEVKTALRAVLVKRKGEREIFDRTFDLFFAPLEEKERSQLEHQLKEEHKKQQIQEAGEELTFEEDRLELTDQEKYIYSQMSGDDKKRIKDFLNRAEAGKAREWETSVKPILETVVKGTIRKWLKTHHAEIDLREKPSTGDQEIDYILDSLDTSSAAGGDPIMYEDMQNIKEKDLPRASLLIKRLARHLVTRIARRYKRSKKHQLLDLRRTIRENIRYGGTMFRLKYRSRRIQKPRLLLICDVSGSMARYASFVLQFIYGIHSVLGQIESYIFAEDLERISNYFQPGTDFNHIMVELMNRSKVWGGGTRLHKALQTLQKKHGETLTTDTYVIILSDTKTEAIPQAVEELTRLRKQVKDLLWLNTLPEKEWPDSKTTRTFQKYAKMYPANTLNDLEKITRSKIFT